MRRPVKPFVTEYRGSARRQAGAHGGQGARLDPTKLDPANLDPERSQPRPAEQWPPQSRTATALQQEDGYEAALRAADALFSGRSDKTASTASLDPEPPGSEPSTAAHPSGGRILRVIDEPPPPEMLRREAELAPKRRGRKPGSKNKPKLPSAAIEAAVAPVAVEQPVPTTGSFAALPAASFPLPRPPVAVGPRGDRYAWVRTKLKPGQQWKRRIPKVAW